ncbi:hypothetical protein PLESTB_001196400 [Pleodorina starrii]|uniref:NIPSNAP domain-containing protein n=1 Tax=Pleodorina starrii TaxID=330485 RepID=A0A9W6BSN0_9CHLO|nr:hypothetical protein PLESTM_001833900 [Pleodorina starrii]GLC57185.1 hypothetical protein PLESTB_001196400 [Pleodorina starrii]GLC71434.1 hypothetical protein PLESTF_001115500 [Pleodorina starrii]
MLAKLFRQGPVLALGRAFAFQAASSSPGLIEIREYTLKPEGMSQFMKVAAEYAGVRRELLPFLGLFTCDVGSCLHRVTHLYAYSSFEQRDEVRAAAVADPRWREFIERSRPHVQYQENKVMLEARPIYEALKLPPTALFSPPPKEGPAKVVYEMRSYQLHPGYGSVPKLVEAFSAGLPAKVEADPEGRLAFFGYTDVGMLNNVVEIWRYPSAQACIRARQAARTVGKWRETIAAVTPGVQHFTSAFLNPAPFSPWQ